MNPKIKRKNFFIKKELQGKYIFSYFLFVIFGCLIFTATLSYFSANTITIIYENYNLELGATPLILLKKVFLAHWVFILCGGLLIVIGAIFLTHRIAGPLYKIEKSIDRMIAGEIGFETFLRKKDEGKEVVEKVNQLNRMLAEKFSVMKQISSELDSKIEAISVVTENEVRETIDQKVVVEIHTLSTKLNNLLKEFKL